MCRVVDLLRPVAPLRAGASQRPQPPPVAGAVVLRLAPRPWGVRSERLIRINIILLSLVTVRPCSRTTPFWLLRLWARLPRNTGPALFGKAGHLADP
jgi:hypothetical protein